VSEPDLTVARPDSADLLPSDEDVATYRERGYYVSKVILDEQVIDAAIAGADRFYAGDVDEPIAPVPDLFMPTGSYSGLRKHDYARMLNRDLERLVLQPIIGAIAARLSGSSSIRLWHDQLLFKPPDSPGTLTNVGWHTDRGYWQCCSSDNMLTAWIPFHDCDASMGTVTMVPGSQLWTTRAATSSILTSKPPSCASATRAAISARCRWSCGRGRSASTTAGPSTAVGPIAPTARASRSRFICKMQLTPTALRTMPTGISMTTRTTDSRGGSTGSLTTPTSATSRRCGLQRRRVTDGVEST